MKPAAVVCEEILRLLSETRSLTLTEIARETKVCEEDAGKILDVLVAAGFVIRTKQGVFTIDSRLKEIVLSSPKL